MTWIVAIAVVLLAGCGSAASSSHSSASALLTGDTCAFHQDANSCRADTQGCSWYPNTRACQVGAPCPAGWCYSPEAPDGGITGDGGISASAGCVCPGAGDDTCVEEIGGTAVQGQDQPSITCEAVATTCTLPDRCGCVSNATLGTCAGSLQVTGLCVCDNGIR